MESYSEAIFIGLLLGTVSFFIPWLYKRYTFGRDSQKIITFIKDSKYTFRSTENIAQGTKLTLARALEVCQKNKNIIENKKTPGKWRVL